MLIILDRDGVINQDSENFIKSPQEWRPIPGSLEAIAALNQARHTVVVVTNQSGIARGYFSATQLMAIHLKMQKELAKVDGHLDGIYFCPHRNEDRCPCRKPNPGMLWQIAKDFNVDLAKQGWLIGDTLADIQAAQTTHCRAALVRSGKKISEDLIPKEIPIYKNLAEIFLSS